MVPAPESRLSAVDIRARFNAGRYAERAEDNNDLSCEVVEIRDIGPAPSWAPAGARSQVLRYEDEHGMTVAVAHQYGFPGGAPVYRRGRPTKPDPKFVFEEDPRFKLDPRL